MFGSCRLCRLWLLRTAKTPGGQDRKYRRWKAARCFAGVSAIHEFHTLIAGSVGGQHQGQWFQSWSAEPRGFQLRHVSVSGGPFQCTPSVAASRVNVKSISSKTDVPDRIYDLSADLGAPLFLLLDVLIYCIIIADAIFSVASQYQSWVSAVTKRSRFPNAFVVTL